MNKRIRKKVCKRKLDQFISLAHMIAEGQSFNYQVDNIENIRNVFTEMINHEFRGLVKFDSVIKNDHIIIYPIK